MPEKGKTTKHKTSICRRTSNPVWNCTFIFDDVAHQDLKERALELDIWNHDRLATKEFLGGLRLNLGTGEKFRKNFPSRLRFFFFFLLNNVAISLRFVPRKTGRVDGR